MQRLSQTTREQWTAATKMSKGSKRRQGEGFEDNYDQIFSKDRKIQRGVWIYDEDQRKMVKKEDFSPRTDNLPHIQADIEPFVSPIDGRTISSRSTLRQHNKEYGVTNARDYSKEYYDKATQQRERTMRGETPEAHTERIETIKRAIEEAKRR